MNVQAYLLSFLCLPSLFFTLSVMAQKSTHLRALFPQTFQESLYNMTPTEDEQMGFHLWVLKPNLESKMPIRKYDDTPDPDMNRNPLKPVLQQMPNALDDDLHLLPELKLKE